MTKWGEGKIDKMCPTCRQEFTSWRSQKRNYCSSYCFHLVHARFMQEYWDKKRGKNG